MSGNQNSEENASNSLTSKKRHRKRRRKSNCGLERYSLNLTDNFSGRCKSNSNSADTLYNCKLVPSDSTIVDMSNRANNNNKKFLSNDSVNGPKPDKDVNNTKMEQYIPVCTDQCNGNSQAEKVRIKLTFSDSFKRFKLNSKRLLSFRDKKQKKDTEDKDNGFKNIANGEVNSEIQKDVDYIDEQPYRNEDNSTMIFKPIALGNSDPWKVWQIQETEMKKSYISEEYKSTEYLNLSDLENNTEENELFVPSIVLESSAKNASSDTLEVLLSTADLESFDMKDKSKVIEVEFDSLYTELVSNAKYITLNVVDPKNGDNSRKETYTYVKGGDECPPKTKFPTKCKALETDFHSPYPDTISGRRLFKSDCQFDSLLVDNSIVYPKRTSDNLICGVRRCDDDINECLSLNNNVDNFNKEISYCSTLRGSSSSDSNSPVQCGGYLEEYNLNMSTNNYLSSTDENILNTVRPTSIKNSLNNIKSTQNLDTAKEANSIADYKCLMGFNTNTDKYHLESSFDFPDCSSCKSDYLSSSTTLSKSSDGYSPKPLPLERFAMFGSPVKRSNQDFSLTNQDVFDSEVESSPIKDQIATCNSSVPDVDMQLLRKKRPKHSKRSKTRKSRNHKNIGNLATIAEDTVGIGPNAETYEYLFKILVIGNLSTGKTSIIRRSVHKFYSDHYRATVGVDFNLKVVHWDEDITIRLQLWDIAGQERYAGGMTRVYYKGAVGAFVVFDMTDSNSLDAALRWKKDLDDKVTLPNGTPIPSVLLANKCDKIEEPNRTIRNKMEEVCKQAGFNNWFTTSAKEDINIKEAVNFLISKIMNLEKDSNISSESFDSDKISVYMDIPKKRSSKNGCIC